MRGLGSVVILLPRFATVEAVAVVRHVLRRTVACAPRHVASFRVGLGSGLDASEHFIEGLLAELLRVLVGVADHVEPAAVTPVIERVLVDGAGVHPRAVLLAQAAHEGFGAERRDHLRAPELGTHGNGVLDLLAICDGEEGAGGDRHATVSLGCGFIAHDELGTVTFGNHAVHLAHSLFSSCKWGF